MSQTLFYINPANIGNNPTVVIDAEPLGFFPDDELALGEIENRTPYHQLVNKNLVIHTKEDDKYSFGCVHTYDPELKCLFWREYATGKIYKIIGNYTLYRPLSFNRFTWPIPKE